MKNNTSIGESFDHEVIVQVTKIVKFCRERGLSIEEVITLVKGLWGEWSDCKRRWALLGNIKGGPASQTKCGQCGQDHEIRRNNLYSNNK